MTDPLPSDVRLLLATGWTRHERPDKEPLWTRAIDPAGYHSSDAAAKRQLRAMGWRTVGRIWNRTHGYVSSFAQACDWARIDAEQLRDHGKAPSSHGDAASPPAPGADPPGEPEPGEGDSVAARLHALDQEDTPQILAFVLDLTLGSGRSQMPVMGDQRTPRARMATILGVLKDYDEALQRERIIQHNARQDVIAAALAWADQLPAADIEDDLLGLDTAEQVLYDAVASYRGQR